MEHYIHIPTTVSLNDIEKNNFSMSSSQYKKIIMPNKNYKLVKNFLSRPLKRSDLGIEVGSINYIKQSPYHFIRTKALQTHTFLPELSRETALPIMPSEFVQMNLKEGDLLISKDSNIGEIVILDKDYTDYMLSGGIYRLPVKEEWRFYLLAMIKHNIFREQLDFIVPKGATIRHAKKLFLDCKIPLPNTKGDETIQYISVIAQAIVNKEKLIRKRHHDILKLIDDELTNNQKQNQFTYRMPQFRDICNIGRLDSGLYSIEHKVLEHMLLNYSNNCLRLKELGYKVLRGPNLAVSVIGVTHYASSPLSGKYYKLVQGVDLSEYGTIQTERYFGNKKNIQKLKEGDILFSAEGSIGKVYIIVNMKDKTVTNYHGMSITNSEATFVEKCFVGCFFFWFRNKRWFDFYSVGGQGGSFGKEKTENLPIPCFPMSKQKEIASLYCTTNEYDTKEFTIENFLDKDNEYNMSAGIYELDKSAKYLKEKLNKAIDDITNDIEVDIIF
jgi:type I restriction enzyme S subunit